MKNTIKCPHCKGNIAVDEALRNQFEQQARDKLKAEFEKKLANARKRSQTQLESKIRARLELEMKDKQEELKELKTEKRRLTEQMLELNKTLRQIRTKDEQRQLIFEKKLTEAQERTKSELKRRFEEAEKLKIAEKQEQIESMRRVIDELKRKGEQGSMQTQGEALEVSLENTLRKEFPGDVIEPVEKGIRGADIAQTVRSPRRIVCGVILWETKRSKAFSLKWLTKLKSDLRQTRAHIPALITQTLPKDMKQGIGLKNGVWIASPHYAIVLARLLRERLLAVGYEKAVHAHAHDKASTVYNYLTSHEFGQQVEAMVEVYHEMNQQIEKERIAFEKQWKARQMQVRKLFTSVGNVYGALSGIAGSSIPQVKGLEVGSLPEGTAKYKEKIPVAKRAKSVKEKTKSTGIATQNSLI